MDHVVGFYSNLFSKEEWDRATLDNLEFSLLDAVNADWLEKGFDEEEVKEAIFNCGGEKAPGLDGFPLAFFLIFWEDVKGNVLDFMREFHERGKLSKHSPS